VRTPGYLELSMYLSSPPRPCSTWLPHDVTGLSVVDSYLVTRPAFCKVASLTKTLELVLIPWDHWKKRKFMSTKKFSRSTIKTVKVTCDRCKHLVEGIRGEEFSAGFYDMSKWEEYRRDNERYVCESCMFADPKYIERFGSCFWLVSCTQFALLRGEEKYSCLCFALRGKTWTAWSRDRFVNGADHSGRWPNNHATKSSKHK